MKLRIRYMRTVEGLDPLQVLEKGEWVDLRLAETVHLTQGEFKILSLGIRMQIPKGYEAWIVPRSGTYKNFRILQTNSKGVVDHTYSGPNDIWGFPALAMEPVAIQKNTRMCQFRIISSQFATKEQKQDWLMYDGVEFVEEEWLEGNEESRGGFGSTGEK